MVHSKLSAANEYDSTRIQNFLSQECCAAVVSAPAASTASRIALCVAVACPKKIYLCQLVFLVTAVLQQ